MHINVTEEEMMKRIDQIENRLEVIGSAHKEAMSKPFFMRNRKVVMFLYIEKKIYTAVLNELKSILYA